MGRLEAVLALLLPLLLVGCGAEAVRMLHERPSFTGKITLKSDTLSLAGELVFDRESGHCELKRGQSTTVTLGRDREGQLFAFEDGKPSRMRPEERRELRLVLAIVDGNGITDARARERGYSVQVPVFGEVHVALEEAQEDAHHRGR
jgi:hypothetical protein